MPSRYHKRSYLIPADLEEVFTARLWSLGPLGLEIGDGEPGGLRVDAYFEGPVAEAVFDLEPWAGRGVRPLAAEEVADRDWLAEYRAAAEPFDVGRRLRVDPRDPEPGAAEAAPPAGGRLTLRIPARSAFGTGSHESTRLALEWLEELDLSGLAVLDVGTGSGILSFAAELFGARRVAGFDSDAQAVCLARQNARRNSLAPLLFAGRAAALERGPRFDLALVNVLPENVFPEVPRLLRSLGPRARVISSGNLSSRRGALLARWAGWGLTLEGEKTENDWVAFLLRRSSRFKPCAAI